MPTAEKIKELRKRRGLSQDDLARELDVSQNLVSAWERGASLPRLPELVGLVAMLGTTADYLLDDADERSLESLGVELKVREIADRHGWEAVYDRLVGMPAKSTVIPRVGEPLDPDTGLPLRDRRKGVGYRLLTVDEQFDLAPRRRIKFAGRHLLRGIKHVTAPVAEAVTVHQQARRAFVHESLRRRRSELHGEAIRQGIFAKRGDQGPPRIPFN